MQRCMDVVRLARVDCHGSWLATRSTRHAMGHIPRLVVTDEPVCLSTNLWNNSREIQKRTKIRKKTLSVQTSARQPSWVSVTHPFRWPFELRYVISYWNRASACNGFWDICIPVHLGHQVDLYRKRDHLVPRYHYLQVLHSNRVSILQHFWDNQWRHFRSKQKFYACSYKNVSACGDFVPDPFELSLIPLWLPSSRPILESAARRHGFYGLLHLSAITFHFWDSYQECSTCFCSVL